MGTQAAEVYTRHANMRLFTVSQDRDDKLALKEGEAAQVAGRGFHA